MDIKQIKEMLANPDVRQVIEEQINKTVAEKQASLDAERAKLTEAKKVAEKELFLLKKTILAKSSLYESKLKEYYEAKFSEAKKKLGKEVFEFINESVKNLTVAIEEDVKSSGKQQKMQEAFATAVRAMAPFMNVNELVENNQTKIEQLTKKLNSALRQVKTLEAKTLGADLHTLVVSECAGYPTEKIALLYETVIKMEPSSLTEGKEALEAAKSALKEKEDEIAAANKKVVTESTKVVEPRDRTKLKVMAESIKSQSTTSDSLVKTKSALDYEVYLG